MSSISKPVNTSRIQVLPEELANKIAAGEVVERPASVVKELLENSIDAQATRIVIEVEAAGKELIRVSDNGAGMSPEDARLAFRRHATSKICRPEDLASIRTLGFRGEALPSIASIAKVRLSSFNEGHEAGCEVCVEGGTLLWARETAHPRGTTVEARQIFFNTPARKKFLKGDATEFAHIAQAVTHQALAHPRIHFTLTHNGRQVLNVLPTEHAQYRIAELFGTELAKELVQVGESSGDYLLEGYVSNPVFTRANRSAQYFFINGRFVRDRVVLHAVQHGYSHLLPKDQHPALFLYLSMDPRLLDVNVHPAKAEVRFANQQEVHQFISRGIRNALGRNESSPSASSRQSEVRAAEEPSPPPHPGQTGPRSQTAVSYSAPLHSRHESRDLSRALERFYQGGGEPVAGAQSSPERQIEIFDRKPSPLSSLIYSEFEPVGQLDNSFIILQGKKGIVIVDQHIAHERVLYERFREAAKNRKIEVQGLLFPLAVEFPPDEAHLLSAHLEMLGALGLELEPFGSNGFLLRSAPAIFKNDDYGEMLREIAESLSNRGSVQTVDEKREEIIVTMACRNAIKVNHPLEPDQIGKLLFDLERTEMPYTCPHGRPISLLFDMEDILRKFLRK
ncbi:MAG: DNA mismatch repair endonuclease MutL [Nitrospinae bacterium]|nr:DNA mismatch repair endonuclease MutL [Nitrospinota bacterium]